MGLMSGLMGNASNVNKEEVKEELKNILAANEEVESALNW